MKLLFCLSYIITFESLSFAVVDNIYTAKNNPNQKLVDVNGRVWNAAVLYTTDGAGNVAPIASSAATIGTANQGLAGVNPWLVSLPAPVLTPTYSVVTNASSVASGSVSASFKCTNAAGCTVLGSALAQNESVSFIAPAGATIGAISYVATGSSLMISVLR